MIGTPHNCEARNDCQWIEIPADLRLAQRFRRFRDLDAKVRRESFEPVDLFHAHIGGIDTLAVLTVVLLVTFAITDRYGAAWWALIVLAALVLVWIVVALNPRIAAPETYSLPMRRLVGFAAAGIDASLIPVMAYLVGLFAWVLNR